MTEAFIAKVDSFNEATKLYTVLPQIVEFDGTDMAPIKVAALNGIFPAIGDSVLIVTTRNNLDDEKINRYYEASATNGRIVAVITPLEFVFKGNYKIIGNLTVTGNLIVEGNLQVGGLTVDGESVFNDNIQITGDIDMTGNLGITGNITQTGNTDITGSLTVNGVDFSAHTHPFVGVAPGSPGITGAPQ